VAGFVTLFASDLVAIIIKERIRSSLPFGIDLAPHQPSVFEIAPGIDSAVAFGRFLLPNDFTRLLRVVVNP
jgi:hypothetical protein